MSPRGFVPLDQTSPAVIVGAPLLDNLSGALSIMRHDPPMGGARGLFVAWSPDETVRAGDLTIARLKQLGVALRPSNRIARARDLVRRTNQFDVQFDPSDRTTEFAVSEAKKTIFETFFLLRDLQPPTPKTIGVLRKIAHAPDLPRLTGDDHGRDFQAELFTGAVFRAAGFHVDAGEPDLRVSPNGRVWGVAVKRVKSDRQFEARVRKAQKQLANQKLYGFVVVNPEILLARTYAANPGADPSAMLFDRTGDWVDFLDQDATIDRVLAVLALGTSFRLVRVGRQRQFHFRLHVHFRFVTNGAASEITAIRQLSAGMMQNLTTSLCKLSVPLVV